LFYDWLYPLLTRDEKQAFVAELVRLAKTQECGYPPTRQGSVTGHSSEAMIMRDMISAGIAIYDEFPEMYKLAAGRFFREHLPVRNWLYNGHAYHQGDSYGTHRYSWTPIRCGYSTGWARAMCTIPSSGSSRTCGSTRRGRTGNGFVRATHS